MPSEILGFTDSAPEAGQASWSLADLAGRVVELLASDGAAPLSQALELVCAAQGQGSLVAWLSTVETPFFPPDAARFGIDLVALPVLRLPSPKAAARVADKLLRSGAFALIVVDFLLADPFGRQAVRLDTPLLARLAGLARSQHCALVFLNREAGLGSLVSLRARSERRRSTAGFVAGLEILKDRRHGPGRRYEQLYEPPPGLSARIKKVSSPLEL